MPRKPASKSAVGEKALIASLRGRVAKAGGALRLGIGDDCAILRPPTGTEIAITTDFSLENVHFRRDWHPPESVGHRCLARGLSDLAAMGARPAAAFLSLAIPLELTASGNIWVNRFCDGLLALAERHQVPLAGGDTAQSPRFGDAGGLVAADIVLAGFLPRGRALLRSNARPGDVIYVTGRLGGAAAELLALERNPRRFRNLTKATENHPHLFPQPRLAVGARLLASGIASSAIDVSDGLSTDLAHLCEESGTAAEIDLSAIPVHPLARKAEAGGWVPSALDLALHGGEDYELLFTAPAGKKVPAKIAGVPVHPIGSIQRSRKHKPMMEMIAQDGRRKMLEAKGWEHFQK